MMRCPVCKTDSGGYYQPGDDEIINRLAGRKWVEMPLYQRSYSGEVEYISSRCGRCFDKAVKRDERRANRRLLDNARQTHQN